MKNKKKVKLINLELRQITFALLNCFKTQQKMKGFLFMNRRGVLLINPKFQFFFVTQSLVAALILIFLFYFSFENFTNNLQDQLQNTSTSDQMALLLKIENQKIDFLQSFLKQILFVIILITASSLYLSHKIAGPIYRLVQFFEIDLKENNKQQQLKFRRFDFFQEIPTAVNSYLEKSQK